MESRNYIEFWDAQLRALWAEDYPEKLSAYLQSLGVESVLDCAGGSGYPAIELKKWAGISLILMAQRTLLSALKTKQRKQG